MSRNNDKHTPEPVRIPAGRLNLEGTLDLPAGSSTIVVFAHGSGSSRFSRRNLFVARELANRGMGTLLFDLLTAEEDLEHRTRFEIDLLAKRLACATEWLCARPDLAISSLGGVAEARKPAMQRARH